MDGTHIFRQAIHGAPAFAERSPVIITAPCNGLHQVDIGMNSGEIEFPLEPGDTMVYAGPFFNSAETVFVELGQARSLASRIRDAARCKQALEYIARWERGELGAVRPFDLRVPRECLEQHHAG